MKIAFARPPLAGHHFRGSGVYFRRLLKALEQQKSSLSVTEVSLNDRLKGFDLVHYPYFDPFFLTLPVFKKIKRIITVHDLIPLKYPRQFPKGLRGSLKWFRQKTALKNSDRIITDARATVTDIVNIAGIAKDRISVIPLGVDPVFGSLKKESLQRIREKLSLPERYILYVGDLNFNKNLPLLLNSFAALKKEFPRLYLILAGSGLRRSSTELSGLKKLMKILGISDRIFIPPQLADDQLAGLYALAQVYVQPSLDEGFGLTVLEAMASSCPVVCSDWGSLSEVAGEAALFADTRHPSDFIIKIKKVLTDSKARDDLKLRGRRHSRQFSWTKTAQMTIKTYREVLGE